MSTGRRTRSSALNNLVVAAEQPLHRRLLKFNIQKRHVIGHNLGVADGHYVELIQDEQPGVSVHVQP